MEFFSLLFPLGKQSASAFLKYANNMKKYWKQLEENGALNLVEHVYQLSQEISEMVFKKILVISLFRGQNSMQLFVEYNF